MKRHETTGSRFIRATGLIVLACCIPTTLVQAQDNPCGQTTEADIVMMIDLTGSISNGALTLEKSGAKTLLDFFAGADPKPRVAIGTFNGPCSKPNQGGCLDADDRARILSGLTDDYGIDGNPGSNLFATINDIEKGPNSGQTDLSAAINAAQSALAAGAAAPGYIILVSDGTPTIPNPDDACPQVRGPNDFHVCDCPAADAAAIDAKLVAEAAGTQIFTIHFDDGSGFTCPGEPAGGIAFMLALASTPAMFFEGTEDLSGVIDQIAADITCDDDVVFCNGAEACIADECQSSGDPCAPLGLVCDEASASCLCNDDAHCVDGDSCTTDLCEQGTCVNLTIPGCESGGGGGGGGGDPGDGDPGGDGTGGDGSGGDVGGDGGAIIPDDDADGVGDDVDACPGTPLSDIEAVDATGCAPSQLDDDEDGVSNAIDECADTTTGAEVDEVGCAADQVGQSDPDFNPFAQLQPPAPQSGLDGESLCGLCGAGGAAGFMGALIGLMLIRERRSLRQRRK